jgi:hypothetical protein
MPRIITFKIFWWLWVSAELNDYDEVNDHRVGFTAGHANLRLTRTWRVSRREERKLRRENPGVFE